MLRGHRNPPRRVFVTYRKKAMTTTGEGRGPTAEGAAGRQQAAPVPPPPAGEPPLANGHSPAGPPGSHPAVGYSRLVDSPRAARPASHRRPESPDDGPPLPVPPPRHRGRHAAPEPEEAEPEGTGPEGAGPGPPPAPP